jgi:hypothetical protein
MACYLEILSVLGLSCWSENPLRIVHFHLRNQGSEYNNATLCTVSGREETRPPFHIHECVGLLESIKGIFQSFICHIYFI